MLRTRSLALTSALLLGGCGSSDDLEPTPDAHAADALAADAAAMPLDAAALPDAVADAMPDMPPAPPAGPMRFPWGAHFDPAEAAARCAEGPMPRPWWCGGREAADAGGAAGIGDTWLGFRLTDAPCPPADGWEIEAPYAGLDHPDLDRVCRYVWSPAGPASVDALPDEAGIRVERDRQVVGAQAVPDAVWQPLADAWRTQLNLPDWADGPAAHPAPTRVAVLDTSMSGDANGEPREGSASEHGLVVGNIIRAVACPAGRGDAGACAAELSHHLALPRVHGGDTSDRGGTFGSQGEFAEAVVAAVLAWREGGSPRLILNLSLGWTAAHGGDPQDGARFTPQLGLWALDAASCDGVLAIAAAGNRARADAVGATYPAAWVDQPSLCDPSVPPVYAVGGVDGADRPLGVARPGSHPRLLAPASQVILRDERTADPAGASPLSGTSLAAAAASGAAALVWAWRPDLDPAGVMQALYAGAAPIEGLAEIGLYGPVERRRLDVCGALALACVDGDCVEAAPACPGRPADARADHAALLPLMHPDAMLFEGEPPAAGDGLDVADAPYATPQPNVPQCPYCGIGGGLLYGTLTEVEDAVLTAPILHIDDGLDGVLISLPDLPTEVPFKVDIVYDGEVKAAWLSGQLFVDGKQVAVASEIAVGD